MRVGGRYALPPGEIEVISIRAVTREALTDQVARDSGFSDLASLLEVAQHGSGDAIFFIEFVYLP